MSYHQEDTKNKELKLLKKPPLARSSAIAAITAAAAALLILCENDHGQKVGVNKQIL